MIIHASSSPGRCAAFVLSLFLVFSWIMSAESSSTTPRSRVTDKKLVRNKNIHQQAARKHLAKKNKTLQKKHTEKSSEKKKSPGNKGVQARAVYCVNMATNEILMEREADRQLPIASLTKLVTALVALEALPLEREITVPDHIAKIPKSVVGLQPGDTLTVKDLLHGLLIASGNDCAETLACAYPGGRNQFLKAMNRKARSLGAKRTVFYTPSGLDRKTVHTIEGKDVIQIDSNLSTAKEIALIARAAFSNDKLREIFLKKNYVMAVAQKPEGYTIRNTNKLLRDNFPVIGGKTGYTVRAGHCIVTELTKNKDDFLIVVLGSPDQFRDARLVYQKAIAISRQARSLGPDRQSGGNSLTASVPRVGTN